jgi:hypothetical protein
MMQEERQHFWQRKTASVCYPIGSVKLRAVGGIRGEGSSRQRLIQFCLILRAQLPEGSHVLRFGLSALSVRVLKEDDHNHDRE